MGAADHPAMGGKARHCTGIWPLVSAATACMTPTFSAAVAPTKHRMLDAEDRRTVQSRDSASCSATVFISAAVPAKQAFPTLN